MKFSDFRVGGDKRSARQFAWTQSTSGLPFGKGPARDFGTPLSDSVDRSDPNPHLFGDRPPGRPRCTKTFDLGFPDIGPWAVLAFSLSPVVHLWFIYGEKRVISGKRN
jgi:hypothetical protein